jgi:hypothetical protein
MERIPPMNIGTNALLKASLNFTTLWLFQYDFTDQKAVLHIKEAKQKHWLSMIYQNN